MRKMMLAMLRMRMCCCRINGGGTSNRLFATGGFIIVPPSCTIISHLYFFLFSHHLSLILSPLFPLTLLLYSCSISPIRSFYSILFFISDIAFIPSYTSTRHSFIFPNFSSFPLFLSLFCSLLLSLFRCSFIISFYFNSRISTNSPNNFSIGITFLFYSSLYYLLLSYQLYLS